MAKMSGFGAEGRTSIASKKGKASGKNSKNTAEDSLSGNMIPGRSKPKVLNRQAFVDMKREGPKGPGSDFTN